MSVLGTSHHTDLVEPVSTSSCVILYHTPWIGNSRRRDWPSPQSQKRQSWSLVPRGGGGGTGVASGVGSDTTSSSSWTSALDAFWQANPLLAGGVVCGIKATLADLVAQKIQQRANRGNNSIGSSSSPAKIDWRRTFAFMTYGALYQGVVQGLVFNNVYSYLFGDAITPVVVTKKVLFNAFFHDSLICIPMAYAVKAFVYQYSLATAWREYWSDVRYQGLLLKNYGLWMPVNAVLFTVVPPRGRIPVMACVSFFWMILLSTMASRPRKQE